ncbi:protein indeterminate-domain 5, chloroplastic isoform X2 [Cornus florida]|nr:protein indeterminate-domain 5, chloroplastic isoform X2 [Cornus florida]
MATNRFVCEVCNKGFQREQNLQLHRRGHNLPWKLRQKTTKEVKKKVYLCPEPSCVHHDPSRALGDLTGIKKHYSRKHGEKKYKCEKCSKKYAVQSDWKAHSKTCGTREYRCDCGTLFSRRDSFITHRAFCDALAQESARQPPTFSIIGSHLHGSSNMSLGLSHVGSQLSSLQDQNQPSNDLLRLEGARTGQFDNVLAPNVGSAFRPIQSMPSSAFFMPESSQNYHDQDNQPQHGLLTNKPPFHGLIQLSDLQNNTNNPSSAHANMFSLSFFDNNTNTSNIDKSNNNNESMSSGFLFSNHFNNAHASVATAGEGSNLLFSRNILGSHAYNSSVNQTNNVASSHMSATALLQKAAQIGSTTSKNSASQMLRDFGSSSTAGTKSDRPPLAANFSGLFGDNHESNINNLMNSLAGGTGSNIFAGGSGGVNVNAYGGLSLEQSSQNNHSPSFRNMDQPKVGGSDGLTRDFLGVGEIVRSMSGSGYSQRHNQQQQQQHGIDLSSLDSERKAAPKRQCFGDGNYQ